MRGCKLRSFRMDIKAFVCVYRLYIWKTSNEASSFFKAWSLANWFCAKNISVLRFNLLKILHKMVSIKVYSMHDPITLQKVIEKKSLKKKRRQLRVLFWPIYNLIYPWAWYSNKLLSRIKNDQKFLVRMYTGNIWV